MSLCLFLELIKFFISAEHNMRHDKDQSALTTHWKTDFSWLILMNFG